MNDFAENLAAERRTAVRLLLRRPRLRWWIIRALFAIGDRRWRSSSAADYRAVPGARIEMLPGLGHTPILEDPARTASALLAFTRDPRP